MPDIGHRVVKLAAMLAIAFGFFILGVEVYRHVIAEGGGFFEVAWFVAAAVMIVLGALVLDFRPVNRALRTAADVAVSIGPFLRRGVGGSVEVTPGTRVGEPAAVAPEAPPLQPAPVVIVPAVPGVPTPAPLPLPSSETHDG